MLPGVEMTGRGPWITTALRGRFYPLDPTPEEVHLDDIACSLSNLCRYNGHCDRFYSVAEHSVIMANQLKGNESRWALLHDAPEAYIGDMVRPLRSIIPYFSEMDARIMRVIAKRFGLAGTEIPAPVLALDYAMCSTEKRDLLCGAEVWPRMPPALPIQISLETVPPAQAYGMFLRKFAELFPGANPEIS